MRVLAQTAPPGTGARRASRGRRAVGEGRHRGGLGAIYEIDVVDAYTVDTGHIVAYEDTLEFKVGKASKSLIGSLLGGEGFVAKFTGQGKLYCQTHNPPSFGAHLGALLKPRRY
mgnify:CR=1 FL=1